MTVEEMITRLNNSNPKAKLYVDVTVNYEDEQIDEPTDVTGIVDYGDIVQILIKGTP